MICEVPLYKLREEALEIVRRQEPVEAAKSDDKKSENSDEKQSAATESTENAASKDTSTMKLEFTEKNILDKVTSKELGDLNWNFHDVEDDDPTKMDKLECRLAAPANAVPKYNPPSLPFTIWLHPDNPHVPYGHPYTLPVSVVTLSAKRHGIDPTQYDFVSLRRSLKRILSFSPQLNTNFQMINGTIYCEDVPVSNELWTHNPGFQMEVYCTGREGLSPAMKVDDLEVSGRKTDKNSIDDADADRVEEAIERQRMEQDIAECQAVCKTSDYYQLLEFHIAGLKLLIAAEIDCVDEDGNAIEIKYGRGDKAVSTWSQCFLSRVSTVMQAATIRQTDAAEVTEIQRRLIGSYFDSDDHRNAQLMVFHNVLRQIKAKLEKDVEGKEADKDSGYTASGIYRLGRYGSLTEATMFAVGGDTRNLITEDQWKCITECKAVESKEEK